ncbi:MAG: type II toxin-antitoxin system VapC family toxin [Saprospiraceae bacterium]|nr:type II toxin-antitoxin system VapC family toxin [Saprospiraceae bacterium]
MICLDTSVLLEYFRKTKKENAFLTALLSRYDVFATSVITEFEIYSGATDEQMKFWDTFFQQIDILPLNTEAIQIAATLFKQLKLQNSLIDMPDLFIAATALSYQLPLATLNVKHFERIHQLELIKKEV